MSELYQGKIVPELIQEGKELTCDNSYCSAIQCVECINYPGIEVDEIKHDYLYEKTQDINIYRRP